MKSNHPPFEADFAHSILRGRSGFTLIEMLVVVAIIGILAALLMPSLHNALASARQAKCVSNMRQIGIGCLAYVTDNNGVMPYNGNFAYNTYMWYIRNYLEINTQRCIVRAPASDPNSMYIAFPSLQGIAFCPSMANPPQSSRSWMAASTATSISYCTGYSPTSSHWSTPGSYKKLISGGWGNFEPGSVGTTSFVANRRMSRIKDRSVIIGDQDWYGVGYTHYITVGAFGGINTKDYLNNPNAPGWKHNFASNFLFKDGSVRSFTYTGNEVFDDDYIPLR